MQYELGTPAYSAADRSPDAMTKLIRKLRWIGWEDEARRLELAAGAQPPEHRDNVPAAPFGTDRM